MGDHPADALDAALLAAMRAGTTPPGAVLAFVIGYRATVDTGLDTTHAAQIAGVTGYTPSAMHRARKWLDEALPGWEPLPGMSELAPPPAAQVAPTPTWRRAISEQMIRLQGRKSWDMYADVYSPAADIVFHYGEIGDLIAITIDFLEAVTGEEIDTPERSRIAKLVRAEGKAALYGLGEAVHRVDTQTVPEYVRYAVAVCKKVNRSVRTRESNGAQASD